MKAKKRRYDQYLENMLITKITKLLPTDQLIYLDTNIDD